MKIAFISDIHGNEFALKTVLADIKKSGIKEIFCLGDIATLGPNPETVVEILKKTKCQFILGNHDEFIINQELIANYIKVPIAAKCIEWSINKLSGKQIDFIRTFKKIIKIKINETNEILLCHGSPHSNTNDILSYTQPDEIDKMIAGCDSSIIVCGHTHIQMLRQHKGRLIINPGSVGFPIKEYVSGKEPEVLPYAEYAILELDKERIKVSFKRLNLNKKKLKEMIEVSDSPMKDSLIKQYS